MKPERYKEGSIFEFADKFGYKSPFGNWMEEERLKREQREKERAEREAEKKAEKESANPTNKTTRYGSVIYFVFLDNYLKDAEKKQVVSVLNYKSSVVMYENEKIDRAYLEKDHKAGIAYARLYQSGVAYYDWSPNS